MSATATANLMTVAEFARLPEAGGPFECELHRGKLVQTPRTKLPHYMTQQTI